MNIEELAKKATKEYMPGCPENLMGFITAKEMFINGYKAAMNWNPMDTAPKDREIVVLVNNPTRIHSVGWCDDTWWSNLDHDGEGRIWPSEPIGWKEISDFTENQ